MIPLPLEEIARITGARLDGGADPSAVVVGPVVIDSRRAAPGGLFAAVAGERADGHDFAVAAIAAGAVAVLGTRPCGAPALIVADVPVALARSMGSAATVATRVTLLRGPVISICGGSTWYSVTE